MSEYLQPHEGVTGTERSGDPIFAPGVKPIIAQLIYDLYDRSIGHRTYEAMQRMQTPQPGDLVFVKDAKYTQRFDPNAMDRAVGYLVLERREWWDTDEEWERQLRDGERYADDQRPVDHAYYVQYGEDPTWICRWTNAMPLGVHLDDSTV